MKARFTRASYQFFWHAIITSPSYVGKSLITGSSHPRASVRINENHRGAISTKPYRSRDACVKKSHDPQSTTHPCEAMWIHTGHAPRQPLITAAIRPPCGRSATLLKRLTRKPTPIITEQTFPTSVGVGLFNVICRGVFLASMECFFRGRLLGFNAGGLGALFMFL